MNCQINSGSGCKATPVVATYTLPVRWYPYSLFGKHRSWRWHYANLCVAHFEKVAARYDYRLVGVL